MTIINIPIPKKIMGKSDLIIVQKSDFEKLNQEKKELQAAFKAVILGELSLRQKKTRVFKDFLKAKFPKYAKSK